MAYEISDGGGTPHATDYSDLLDKLVTFLVGTGDWVLSDDQRAGAGLYAIVKGLDYSGTGAIYVGIKKYANVPGDIFGWLLQGYTALSGTGFSSQPGAIAGAIPALPLWNATIPYWFFANPRRVIVVAKVNGVYMAAYLGLMLPFGSVGQWSYPLVVGGSNASNDSAQNSHPRYSDTSGNMITPFISGGDTVRCVLHVRKSTGIWQKIFNYATSFNVPGTGSFIDTATGIYPFCSAVNNNQNVFRGCRPDLDGNYTAKNLEVMHGEAPDRLGLLDGAFWISPYNANAEDVITISGDDYIVFQDTFRTTLSSFFAIKKV